MAYIRKLPSGKWQATVRGPDGRKHTKTDPLKKVVKTWATGQESKFQQGDMRDPRAGEIRVGEWHRRRAAARAAKVSAPKAASLWATHCKPKWADWQMHAVTRMEAQEWVAELQQTRRARHQGKPAVAGEDVPLLSAETIAAAVHVMSGLYRAAVKETPPIVLANPFADLELPPIEPRSVDFYEADEALALYEAAAEADPKWRTMIELGMQAGLRFEELAGLHGHRVNWLRGRIEVIDVMTRAGLRQWPKSKRSHRVVPVPPAVLEGMSALMTGRPRDSLVFTAPEGGPVSDSHFRNRVWYPAIAQAKIRKFPPRIMRHTAASWLVQDGVPLFDVQVLLGHESFVTTQRYAHLAPDTHSKVLESWSRRSGAPVAHGAVKDLG
jgi:integrase